MILPFLCIKEVILILEIYNEIKNIFIEILFPIRCGICNRINETWICNSCKLKLNKYSEFNLIHFNLLYDKYEVYNYEELLYIFKYKSFIRKLILRYKFNHEGYLFHVFSDFIFYNKSCCDILKLYDIIIPVPMDDYKKGKRGYNQTELIASDLSCKLNIKIDKNSLIKVKKNKTQSKLSEDERKNNIKNVFCVNNKEKFNGKNIIIFDDIYTTGATVNEISRLFKSIGVKKILVFVIAKD